MTRVSYTLVTRFES